MIRLPPRSTRTHTLFPYTKLLRSGAFCKFHQLRICLAEEFDREACKAVAKQEYADELAGLIARPRFPEGNPKHQTKQDALQSRLIQLAGMTRHRAAEIGRAHV